jgi:sirohydrochlorin ferrochelatase
VLLVDHGSRRSEANERLEGLADEVRRRLDGPIVVIAHLEIANPTFAEGAARCVEAGAREVTVHPFFLAPGRHVMEDLPRLIAAAEREHPEVTWRLTPALGDSPALVDLVLEILDGSP